jgi:hypothetical protein
MTVNFTGDWAKALHILNDIDKKYEKVRKRALSKVGVYLKGKVMRGIRDQKPGGKPYKKLHKFTKQRKGSSKAMIDDTDFITSITYKLDGDILFVGVLKQAVDGEGNVLADIAAVHEFGTEIEVTTKMRNYLHAIGLHLKAETTHIKIPARPTFGPVLDAEEDEIVKIIEQELEKGLFGG